MAKAKVSKSSVKEELSELLFKGQGVVDDEGLLTILSRLSTGDVVSRKIARVKALVQEL